MELDPGPDFGQPSNRVQAPPPDAPAYRDRGTGLAVFGVAQIILGLLAALMIPFIALGAFMSRLAPGGSIRPGQFISGVATYAFIATVLIALGIGSLQMKRWARPITLVLSWYWLVMGALFTILLTAMLPATVRSALVQAQRNSHAGSPPEISTGVMAVVLTFIIVFVALFLIMVPVAFIIFYGRQDVAETLRRRDPVERWTDRTPLPILGASLIFALGAVYLLLVGFTAPLFPFFGRYLTGVAATLCFVVTAALDGYISLALFRLHSTGWWIATLTLPIRLASMALTYGRADLWQAYARMGVSHEQLRVLSSNPMLRGHVVLWWSLISIVLLFLYLLWLKRYFRTPLAPSAATVPAPIGQ
ncbi:MAG TPA: hypothetical protein VH350_00585 [Candidatus Sulfotelmatobacter sp.]|nr:hypothetical protein [Candidatus Sulfotelmatobacter sp.]